MRALSIALVAGLLAAAPMALAQTTDTPAATEPAAQEPVYVDIEPADPNEPITAPAAEEVPATAEEPAAQAAVEEPQLVCRTMVTRTESRLRSSRERICRTQAAWDEADAQASNRRNRNAGADNN